MNRAGQMRNRIKLLAILSSIGVIGSCANSRCELTPGVNELFGGGPRVCLGESYGGVERRIPDSDPGQSLPAVVVRQDGASYAYEPGGGLDLVLWSPGARVVRACVTHDTGDDQSARSIAERARAKLGGRWRVRAKPESLLWIRSDGVTISALTARPFTTCVNLRGAVDF